MGSKSLVVTIMALLAGLTFLRIAAGLLVDWLWFSSVAYPGVFWTIIGTKAGLLCGVFLASTLILWANGRLAQRLSAQTGSLATIASPWEPPGEIQYPPPPWLQRFRGRRELAAAAIVVAGLAALNEVGNWDLVLRFIHQAPYGESDPLFGKDIGFYLFSFPAYLALKNWLLLILAASALFAAAVYAAHGYLFSLDERRRGIVMAHGSALLGLFFVVEAWSYWLD